jgi:microcystin-dependent protein
MPLETGTYISDFNTSNPAHTDSVSAADSHLRWIKSAILASFTGVAGAVTATHTQLNSAVGAVVTGAAQAVHAVGSAGAPSLSFLGRLNTGMFSPAANRVGVACNGSQILEINNTGLGVIGLISANGPYQGGTGQLCMIGAVQMWLSNSIPSGFAVLNGQQVSRAANPVLFNNVWGTAYGAGDGSTTFNLPDLRDYCLIGANLSLAGVGQKVGASTHTLTIAELPLHSHNTDVSLGGTTDGQSANHTHGPGTGAASFWGSSGNFSGGITGGGNPFSSVGATGTESATHTHNWGSGGTFGSNNGNGLGGGAHSIVQPSMGVNFITLLG